MLHLPNLDAPIHAASGFQLFGTRTLTSSSGSSAGAGSGTVCATRRTSMCAVSSRVLLRCVETLDLVVKFIVFCVALFGLAIDTHALYELLYDMAKESSHRSYLTKHVV